MDWLLYTSLFASLCAVGLCMATERLLLGVVPQAGSALHWFILGSSFIVYNIHYVVKKAAPGTSDRYNWTQRNRYWHWIMLASGAVLCMVTTPQLPPRALVACVVLAVLSLAYSLPLLPRGSRRRLKDFGYVKILVLAGVWTIVTSILPMMFWHRSMADYPFEIILRFVLLFVLCLAFDIRDMQVDLDVGIYTLPNRIGLRTTYRLIDLMLVLFAVLATLQFFRYPSAVRWTGSLITAVLAKLAIEWARRHPSDKAYLLYVDGVMLWYAVLLLLH